MSARSISKTICTSIVVQETISVKIEEGGLDLFYFYFYFLFLEQLGLGLISHAVTSVT